MLIQASTILNLPVAAIEEKAKIGTVKNLIINPENGELIGLIVRKTGFIFSTNKILSGHDILDIDKNGVVTRKEENLVDIKEVIRIKKIISSKICVLNQKAVTQSGKYLGRVNDLLIESETLSIVKYYIHGIIEDKIFPANKVIEITKKAVIFFDDVIESVSATEMEGAAA